MRASSCRVQSLNHAARVQSLACVASTRQCRHMLACGCRSTLSLTCHSWSLGNHSNFCDTNCFTITVVPCQLPPSLPATCGRSELSKLASPTLPSRETHNPYCDSSRRSSISNWQWTGKGTANLGLAIHGLHLQDARFIAYTYQKHDLHMIVQRPSHFCPRFYFGSVVSDTLPSSTGISRTLSKLSIKHSISSTDTDTLTLPFICCCHGCPESVVDSTRALWPGSDAHSAGAAAAVRDSPSELCGHRPPQPRGNGRSDARQWRS